MKLRIALAVISTITLCIAYAPRFRGAEPKQPSSIFDFGDDDDVKPGAPMTPTVPTVVNPAKPPPEVAKPVEVVVMRPNPANAVRVRPAAPPVVKADVLKPIPDAKVQEAVLKQVKDLFKVEYRALGAERAAGALKLMQAGVADQSDACTDFVLLKEARDMASQAGDARTGLVAARHIASRYSTDLTEMGLGVLITASRAATTPDKAADVAEVAMSLLNRAINAHQFDLAHRIAGIAEGSARFMRSTPLVNNIQTLEKDLLSRRTNAEKLAGALETLKSKPADPEACAIVGRQLCLEENNWTDGLEYLAKGNDAAMKSIALKEASAPTAALPCAELANMWWSAAQNQPVTAKLRMQQRSAYWYALALPGLLKKDQANSRIASAERVMPQVVMMQLPAPADATVARREREAKRGGEILDKTSDMVKQTITIDGDKPYAIAKLLTVPEKADQLDIVLGPGAEVRGGRIYLSGHGHLKLRGTAEKPAILRNVDISMDLGGSLETEYAILDGCTFSKAGGWFSYHSSRWVFKNSVLYKCKFRALDGMDYGFQIDSCRMIGMTFPENTQSRRLGKEFNHMDYLRKDMDHIAGSEFVECVVSPTIAWCAEGSNFITCKFAPGEAFEGDENFEWKAFVADTVGEAPQAIFGAHPGTRGKVVVMPSDSPAVVPRVGEKLIPEIIYTTRAVERND